MFKHTTKAFVRRAARFALWICAGIAGLIILAVVALQFPHVQRYIAHKVVSSISEKTQSRIEIGSVSIAFTNSVVLRDIFVESRERDTLLFIHTLAADVNLFGLFSQELRVNHVRIDSLTAHITRTLPDSSFNFDFIVDALGPDSSTAVYTPLDASAESGMRIFIGGLSLHGAHMTYHDDVSGLNLRFQVGALGIALDEFDLDKNRFQVSELSLENATASVIQTKETPAGESEPSDLNIGVESVSLANLHLAYHNTVSGERYGVDLGTSNLIAGEINLHAHRITIKSFSLENTHAAVIQTQSDTKNGPQAPDIAGDPWVISLDQLALNGNSLQYDVEGAEETNGLDLNHLRCTGLAIKAGDMYFTEGRIAANIRHLSFKEQSGLDVRGMSGNVAFDSLHAELSGFTLKTSASHITQDVLLTYPSLATLRDSPGNVNVKTAIGESKIGLSDVFLFHPSLPMKNRPGASITISTRLSGPLKNLRIEEFRLAGGESTTVDLSGSVRGLPEAGTAYYDVNLHLLSTGRDDIHSLVADTLLPENIVLPLTMKISGNFSGTMKDFSASSNLVTSIGSVSGSISLTSDNGPDSKASQWKADVTAAEFDVGALLNDTETFGPVSLKASATGIGLSKEDVQALLTLNVEKAVLNGYPYTNLSASGTAGPQMFEGTAEIRDSNIAFVFTGTVNTGEEDPTYKFNLDLKGADLQRLGLTSDDMRVSGVMTSDLVGQDLNDINGIIDLRNVVIIKNRKRYLIDSLVYASVNKEGETHISLESSLFAAHFEGTIAPGDLPGALKDHFSRYFTLHDTSVTEATRAQAFAFQVTLRDPAMLTDVFFPQLNRLSAGVIEGNFDSEKRDLNASVVIHNVDYDDLRVDSLSFKVVSDADHLEAALHVGSISDSILHITNLQLTATVEHDSMDVALQSTDDSLNTKMLLAGVFNSVPDGYQFRFKPGGVVFQNIPWTVPADNYLLFGDKQFIAHNVVLRGGGQFISINSTDREGRQPPLEIEFARFNLGTISQVVERHTGLVGGVLDGSLVLHNLDKHIAFTSDLTLSHLSFREQLVGDVRLRANNLTLDVYEVGMDITGNENDIAMQGRYLSKEGGSDLDLNLDFKKMNLASIEPFLFGEVQRLSGTMTGALHITGALRKPSITGSLTFTNSAFTPTLLGSHFRVNRGEIGFNGTGVNFESFELIDTLGNKASLRGSLRTEDFRDFSYDVRIHTNNFLLMNKPASRDALYYGTVVLDSDILVRGNQAKPVISMQARLDKGTDLAVILPESETAVEQRRGIVKFVDVANPANTIMARRNREGRTTRDTTGRELSAIDLTSNIEVDKDSRLRILIDPVAGDSLVIRGEATFSVGMDPSGKLSVTGRYEILEGSYRLSFGDFIRREFEIEKGSSLTWFGSVTEANVDITAIHTVKTSALDLVQDQLVGLSLEERNKYRQDLRIQVHLMMDGKLLEPNIRFKLDLAPDQRGALGGAIYAKLNEVNGQESELNKQVFALLILGRFIASNPLASSDESGLAGFARSSASQILSEQLNRLSEKYITGVNVEVGLESGQDYSTGTAEGRTQLQLALSKQLFDERVTVQIGGNVDLEGQRSEQNSLNNFAGDIKVAYKLTEDGRWQLQVFRENAYEGAIEGDLVKTGIGIVFTIDYDKLFGFTLTPVPANDEEQR